MGLKSFFKCLFGKAGVKKSKCLLDTSIPTLGDVYPKVEENPVVIDQKLEGVNGEKGEGVVTPKMPKKTSSGKRKTVAGGVDTKKPAENKPIKGKSTKRGYNKRSDKKN